MTKRRRTDPDQTWLDANATDIERVEAFKVWSEGQWGMPTFSAIRKLVEARRYPALTSQDRGRP